MKIASSGTRPVQSIWWIWENSAILRRALLYLE